MGNPETRSAPGTRYIGRRQLKHTNNLTKTQKTKRLSNTDPTKNKGWIQVFVKG